MNYLKFKRGDTYHLQVTLRDENGDVINITGYTIESQIRQPTGELISTLTTTLTDPTNGTFTLEDTDTQSWPVGCQFQDIEYTGTGGTVTSTETFKVDVQEDITQ